MADPPALPSPPTSPTSPRTATARIRIKPSRRPNSICHIPSTASENQVERTRSMSPSLPGVATTPGSETTRTTTRPSMSIVVGKRRQSSIAYYTPSSPAPWSQRPQPNRTLSSGIDSPRDVEPVVANGKENLSKRSSLVLSSRSPSTRESVSSLDAVAAREREPLTLVEKHADLLHFIAQKERKCLELRDQLTAHEKELAELKCQWERIVNRGHDTFPNSPTSGLGGVALDGLKEGVRMIAAGFSDLGGVIDPSDDDPCKHKPLTHVPRENSTSSAHAIRASNEHLSMSSTSSIRESAHASDHVFHDGEGGTTATTVATAPSLARASSLGSRMHKRASRVVAKEPTTPRSTSVSPPAQSPKSINLDMGMSLVLAPSPTLVPPMLGTAFPASPTPKSSVLGPTLSHRPTSSWMDSMGKKLSDLHRGQTFSKGQKRASSLLAGVSSTISAALLPGPTATTPAPMPASLSSPKASLATRSPPARSKPEPGSQPHARSYPSYRSMADWLDDEEEKTVHASGTEDVPAMVEHDEGAIGAGAAAASSFDDDWNW